MEPQSILQYHSKLKELSEKAKAILNLYKDYTASSYDDIAKVIQSKTGYVITLRIYYSHIQLYGCAVVKDNRTYLRVTEKYSEDSFIKCANFILDLYKNQQNEASQNETFLGSRDEKALRFNEGKLQWSLVDFKALEPLVQVLMYGAKKYSRDNWKKGLDWNETIDSLMRHIVDIQNGKTIDDESQLPIIGHILANVMFLSHIQQNNEVS